LGIVTIKIHLNGGKMNNITPNKNYKVESASEEKTLEYTNEEGNVKEKTTVNYKLQNDNAIDNTVKTITESQSVRAVSSFFNKALRLSISLFAGCLAGAISFEILVDIFSQSKGKVPENLLIAFAVIVSLITATTIYPLYSKYFIKRN
jgi:hypothetical protein